MPMDEARDGFVTISPMDPVVRDILEVALSEFANYGFEGTRIEAITARMATSKRMIYYHFGSKEKLFLAAADRVMRRIHEHITAVTAPVTDPLTEKAVALVSVTVMVSATVSARP